MTQKTEITLEIITDSLAGGYQQLAVGTFQEASEIMNARRLEPNLKRRQELRDRHLYTANLFLARIRDGNLEYALSGRKAFDGIAGLNIEEFSRQLINSGFYKLTPEQIRALPDFADIEWANASRLNLQIVPGNPKWSFIEIDTFDYFAEKLNNYQRMVVQKPYGSMERKQADDREYTDFGENMKMLNEAGKNTTKIYLPAPKYVKQFIKEGEVVARASGLIGFKLSSRFFALGNDVGNSVGLRGHIIKP